MTHVHAAAVKNIKNAVELTKNTNISYVIIISNSGDTKQTKRETVPKHNLPSQLQILNTIYYTAPSLFFFDTLSKI